MALQKQITNDFAEGSRSCSKFGADGMFIVVVASPLQSFATIELFHNDFNL